MKCNQLGIPGAFLFEFPTYHDDRGRFNEWFKFEELSENTKFSFEVRQANLSVSKKGVLRGIHYSLAKTGQSKWVTCAAGSILDFVVDIRPDSPTYKHSVCIKLIAGDGQAVFIGSGLGHAFLSIDEGSVVSYLLDSPYSPSEEFEVNPMDPELNIDWQQNLDNKLGLVMSPKDANAPSLAERLAQNKLPFLFN